MVVVLEQKLAVKVTDHKITHLVTFLIFFLHIIYRRIGVGYL
jgi:hypothetical protein